MLSDVKIAFVECNREQLDYFSKELTRTGVKVLPVLTDDLFEATSNQRRGSPLDMVVTTFSTWTKSGTPSGDLRTSWASPLTPISNLSCVLPGSLGSQVPLVCISERFAERIQKSMELTGITEPTSRSLRTENPQSFRRRSREGAR